MKQQSNISKQRPKKSLGQNFIHDENFLEKLSKIISSDDETDIIEIGPGKGALTKYVSKKKFRKYYLIEKDHILASELKNTYQNYSNIKIFNHDALDFDYSVFNKKSIIIGNLPFNISSQLLFKWLEIKEWPPFYHTMILMFQKEMAERIISRHDTKIYGRISVSAQIRCKIYKKIYASSNIFYPKPKVDGLVLEFRPHEKYRDINFNKLQILLKEVFIHRRKKIKNSLKKNLEALNELNIDTDLRAENLSIEDYYNIIKLIN